jgi:cobalt-precorrin 5A hydrolase
MIAIGVGCRRGATKNSIIAAVQDTLSAIFVGDDALELFSVEDKRDELGLIDAATALGVPLEFLPRASLRRVDKAIVTPSHRAVAALGLTSISEASALVGAGRGAMLIMPRIVCQGVTCAAARGEGR